MRWLSLLLLFALAACVPTYTPSEGRVSFFALDGALYFASNTDANISHGSALVSGEVTSKRTVWTDGTLTVLELPEGTYPRTVRVGQYQGAVSGEATIALVDGRDGLETELEIR